jgi:hypothetical protein
MSGWLLQEAAELVPIIYLWRVPSLCCWQIPLVRPEVHWNFWCHLHEGLHAETHLPLPWLSSEKQAPTVRCQIASGGLGMTSQAVEFCWRAVNNRALVDSFMSWCLDVSDSFVRGNLLNTGLGHLLHSSFHLKQFVTAGMWNDSLVEEFPSISLWSLFVQYYAHQKSNLTKCWQIFVILYRKDTCYW